MKTVCSYHTRNERSLGASQYFFNCVLKVILFCMVSFASFASAQSMNEDTVSLVGNKVPTLIDTDGNPARAMAIVQEVLKNENINITATSQTWSGSGLRNGRFIGLIDHYSLNDQRSNYIYSDPYMLVPLHIASKRNRTLDVTRLDKIYRQSVGIENRFANTDTLRSERSVRWARSPDFLELIQKLVDRRTEFVLADKYMLEEVNKMIVAKNEQALFISSTPIQNVELRLAIRREAPNAQSLIDTFNSELAILKSSDIYQNLLQYNESTVSALDEALYQDILRKW